MKNRTILCEKQKNYVWKIKKKVAEQGNGKIFLFEILNGFVPAVWYYFSWLHIKTPRHAYFNSVAGCN